MQTFPESDLRRYSLALLARLEHPRPLDAVAWRDLGHEYGLPLLSPPAAVVAAWAALLAETHPLTHADRPTPQRATTAIPGTPLKVEVMRLRRARGEALCHPGDAPLLQDRACLIPGRERHNGRSQVQGVGEEAHDGLRRVA